MKIDRLKARLGKALRQVRRSRNVDGGELARRLGKQATQIYRWERGEAAAGIDQVYRYLEALGASFAELDEALEATKRQPGSHRLKAIAEELRALAQM